MGRKTAGQLSLSMAEREALAAVSVQRETMPTLALRARIVLACADGWPNKVVAQRLGASEQTVGKWRARYIVRRLDGLLDAPRSGAPRRIGNAQIDAVIARTMERPPGGTVRWSTASMARETGLGKTAVWRIWRAFGLQPHRTENGALLGGGAVSSPAAEGPGPHASMQYS